MKKTKKRNRLGKVEYTDRGFAVIKFKDHYDKLCRLQQSSLADYNCIWLGILDADPKVMWIDAAKVGVKTDAQCGWVPYPVPPEVLLHTEMHLNTTQVRALVERLQHWLKTGSLK